MAYKSVIYWVSGQYSTWWAVFSEWQVGRQRGAFSDSL